MYVKKISMEDKIKEIGDILDSLLDIDMATLSAALSLLPDVREDGTSIVIASAARIAAERFPDKEQFLEKFKEGIESYKASINPQS